MKPYRQNKTVSGDTAETALELKDAFHLVSPFIEKHTTLVCPECEQICCADKHGRYDKHDLLFLNALGIAVPDLETERKETDACRYISRRGCTLERWLRPFRCTFFFCDALLKSLEQDNAKLYRAFTDYFSHLTMLRQKLLK
jgi:hypothetical protein